MGISFIIFLQRIVGMRKELPLEGRGLAQIVWSGQTKFLSTSSRRSSKPAATGPYGRIRSRNPA